MKGEINDTFNALPLPWMMRMVITGVVASLLALSGNWAGNVDERLNENLIEMSAQKERIEAQEKRVNEILISLTRIENKIDKITEREITRGGK